LVKPLRVEIDYDRCIASGACVAACPEVFQQDELGIVVLRTDSPDNALESAARDAAAACPTACIEISG
jgi:ferredoxin